MPGQVSEKRSALGKHAAAVRWNSPDRDSTARDLAVARIAEYVERIVTDAPPLTQAQRDRIASLLRGGGSE